MSITPCGCGQGQHIIVAPCDSPLVSSVWDLFNLTDSLRRVVRFAIRFEKSQLTKIIDSAWFRFKTPWFKRFVSWFIESIQLDSDSKLLDSNSIRELIHLIDSTDSCSKLHDSNDSWVDSLSRSWVDYLSIKCIF